MKKSEYWAVPNISSVWIFLYKPFKNIYCTKWKWSGFIHPVNHWTSIDDTFWELLHVCVAWRRPTYLRSPMNWCFSPGWFDNAPQFLCISWFCLRNSIFWCYTSNNFLGLAAPYLLILLVWNWDAARLLVGLQNFSSLTQGNMTLFQYRQTDLILTPWEEKHPLIQMLAPPGFTVFTVHCGLIAVFGGQQSYSHRMFWHFFSYFLYIFFTSSYVSPPPINVLIKVCRSFEQCVKPPLFLRLSEGSACKRVLVSSLNTQFELFWIGTFVSLILNIVTWCE